jgi:two-component system alkaline phosphatase synthesis response regulator PhoP
MSAFRSERPDTRVLIAEDDPEIGALLAAVLGASTAVTVVSDAEAALDLIAREPAFDLIISDYMLPGINGLEFVERLRGGGGPATPVLLITGHATLGIGDRALASGIEAFLCKPFSLRELRGAVMAVLDPAARRTEVEGLTA